ncbi:zinc ribbon domain-containing protein [Cupriavidus campinensis]
MPTYDYRCDDCGDFALMRPMARRDEPAICPGCGKSAARALVAAPALASMGASARAAHAVNERSAAAPKESSSHGAGCGCCGPVKLAGRSDGVKRSEGRPWMISH